MTMAADKDMDRVDREILRLLPLMLRFRSPILPTGLA